jgi:translocation and assembly module TamB
MRRLKRVLTWALGLLVLLPVLAVAGLFVALNIGPGRVAAELLIGKATGGMVVAEGLHGRFPDRLRLEHLEVHDATGAWLVADGLALDWSPTALVHKQVLVDLLTADRVQVPRLPVSAPAPATPTAPSKPFSLPVQVVARRIHADRVELGSAVLGAAAVASLDGSADLPSLEAGRADLRLQRLDAGGTYAAAGHLDAGTIGLTLDVAEPDGGLIAHLATLPALGPITIKGSLEGPRSAAVTALALTAGPLRAEAKGTLDLVGNAADLDVSASAPAMTPREDVSWAGISLQARVRGPFTKPEANGQLRVDALQAAGAALQRLTADVQGNAGRVGLHLAAEGVRLPGPAPDLLAAAPVLLDADAQLDDPSRPVSFTLSHPLLTANGQAQTGGDLSATVDLTAPDLAPFAAIGKVDLHGKTSAHVVAGVAGGVTRVDLDGAVSITGGLAPVPALVGQDAKLGVSAQVAGTDITLSRLEFAGKALSLSAQGSSKAGVLDAGYKIGLADLAVLAPTLSGNVEVDGRAAGKPDALSVDATAQGAVGAPGVPRGPVTVRVALQGLPGAPAGHVEAEGQLLGAPLALALDAQRAADGALHATISRADWRSLHAEGALTLPAGATLPQGRVQLRMTRLADLDALVGQPLTGSITADLQSDEHDARLDAAAQDAGLPSARVHHATLTARVADPTTRPLVTAALAVEGIEAGGATGSAKVDVSGPQDALAVRTTAALRVQGTDAAVTGAAVLDLPGKRVALSALQVAAKGETLRLLAPATVRFGDGVAVDRLRLGLRQAVLEVAGRASPTLDLTASLRAPADIAAIAAPDLAADGTVTLDAKLTGTPARPGGTVKLGATGVRLRSGPGRALPAANLTATADLAGTAARIDARLTAGSAVQLAVTGQAPLGAGALNLRAQGGIDLTVLDPVLTPAGRRARGRVTLDAGVTGTAAAPRLAGTARLAGGEIQDFGQGVHITDLAASLRADGNTVRIVSLQGRAGPGTVAASGTVGVLAPGLPVDLTVTLRNARPLESDLLTADLDTDLTLRGPVAALQAAGSITVRTAEIRIPERLPATVAVLDVRRPGQRPPAPAAAGNAVGLDLTVKVPQAVFVRGRGVDAELAGNLRIHGTSLAPQVAGGLEMRRGSISVAGTTLTFSRGKVGFDGTGVTGKIDPTLDFAADSVTSTVTATLGITGYASAPKISLTSTPELPQDEVLAYLLFKRSAKELGPFQLAEIAAAVADLTGVGGGSLSNPLERVRKGLGLDRLSVGSSSGQANAAGGSSSANAAPSVEAGRYVANGVYVGAKQGTTGAGTGATVQIDITKGLKLQTDVGTGQGGNQVGVTYQFEY